MREELIRNIENIISRENIVENEDMDMHTSFRTGGPARLMLTVNNKEQLKALVKFLRQTGNKFFLLGNGTNILVSDKGYDGIIVKLSGDFAKVEVDGDRIRCGAAALLPFVAHEAAEHGLSGMEFAAGIPGSIGGAMVMNAGAYDGDMGLITENVEVLDPSCEFITLENNTMEFEYRKSVIKGLDYIVTGAELKLTPGNKDEILAKMNELNAERREKQPLEFPSAGSTFKRPEGGFAGKLIMDAGMRGYTIGGARVSDKHCGFIVNLGYASSADIYDVMCEVQDRVKQRFNVKLEREVILLGDF